MDAARAAGPIAVVDPSDGRPFATIARGTAPDIERAVAAARDAFAGRGARRAPPSAAAC
jgi:acyl-CoA reductase-like NAD-dependent aldehyde dehydrogenase